MMAASTHCRRDAVAGIRSSLTDVAPTLSTLWSAAQQLRVREYRQSPVSDFSVRTADLIQKHVQTIHKVCIHLFVRSSLTILLLTPHLFLITLYM